MTVTYSAEVATSRGFGCFWKLLFRWRGSIYKLLWTDLALYVSLYYFLSLIYRCSLGENEKRFFEKVSLYCRTYADLIPVSFVLGFYVSIVVKRWWDSFNCIPWPDTLAFFVSAFMHGQDERGRLMRRTIMRYVNLAFIFTLTSISPCVKKRFPTMDHLVVAGILLPNEKKVIEQMKTHHSTYWMPLVWASSIATRARKEGRIRDDFALKTVVDAIAHYRSLCGGLFNYDWISIPLVYTQVVTLVVYTFFLATLMGRQYLDPSQGYSGHEVDLYIPVFNFLQFFFYIGWLKVAETLVNPFGEDDDDFEVNWVIDRDIQVSYLIVDEMHQEHPELIKDRHWDEVITPGLPYTAAAKPFYSEPPQGSAASLVVPPHEAEFVPLESLAEDEEDGLLEDIKVNGTQSIPYASHANPHLSRHLSESSRSSISGLGRSFHPHSQQRRSIISLLHRLFSKEHGGLGSNVSLQSVPRKSHGKRDSVSRESNASQSSNPSIPPSPSDFREHIPGFPVSDDIFHLSDLSLAESRATSVAHSPGIFVGGLHMPDIFSRLKPDRSHKFPLQSQLPSTKAVNTRGDQEEEVISRQPSILLKRQRTNSLKHFFRPHTKHKGSQKSLLDTFQQDKVMSPSVVSMALGNSNAPTSDTYNKDLKADVQSTVYRGEKNGPHLQHHSISQNEIGRRKSSQISESSNKSEDVIPKQLETSPENYSYEKSAKEASTLTLVATDDDCNTSVVITSPPVVKKPKDTSRRASITSKTKLTFAPSKLFSGLKPKRTVSLLIRGDADDYITTPRAEHPHSRRFYYHLKRQREIIHTGSQPGSPTEVKSNTPVIKFDARQRSPSLVQNMQEQEAPVSVQVFPPDHSLESHVSSNSTTTIVNTENIGHTPTRDLHPSTEV